MSNWEYDYGATTDTHYKDVEQKCYKCYICGNISGQGINVYDSTYSFYQIGEIEVCFECYNDMMKELADIVKKKKNNSKWEEL